MNEQVNSEKNNGMVPAPGNYLPLIINACLTGTVHSKSDSPYLPITVEEIIEDALQVIDAGAGILHLHVRDEKGEPAWRPDAYAPIIETIRKYHPEVVVCVTTSGRLYGDFSQRAAVLELTGEVKPDMASLTLGSMNFPNVTSINEPAMIQQLATLMHEKDILPELEIFEPGMLHYAFYLIKEKYLTSPCYANFILGSLGTSPARVFDLTNLINDVPADWIWAATGIGRFQLPINIASIVVGGNVRVGLEDNLFYDFPKRTLATNRQLVERVVRIAEESGREIAEPKYIREKLGLISK